MIEKLMPVKLQPGMYNNGTRYDAKGRWWDGNLVRWREGVLQAVGLWRRHSYSSTVATNFAGAGDLLSARIFAWPAATGQRVALLCQTVSGSAYKAYAYDPQGVTTALTDITPASGYSEFGRPSMSSFGSSLIVTANSKTYSWDGNLANDLVQITNDPLGTASFTTPERFLVVMGGASSSNYRTIRWADQESTSVWTAASTNTAGDFELETPGTILCGRAAKGQSLVWTDTDLWSMTYIGGTSIFSFRKEGSGCGAMGPGAPIIADGRAYWMGTNGFYVFDGYVRRLRCDVHDRVFGPEIAGSDVLSDARGTVGATVEAVHISSQSEIWWLYRSDAGRRYVSYNYVEDHWSFGEQDRIAGCDAGVLRYPLMVTATGGFVYEHEVDLLTSPVPDHAGSTIYAETGPIELGDGDLAMRLQRIEPDGNNLTAATLSVYYNMSPIAAEDTAGPFSLASPIDLRVTGKLFRLKVTEATATAWRLGTPRFGVIPVGRR